MGITRRVRWAPPGDANFGGQTSHMGVFVAAGAARGSNAPFVSAAILMASDFTLLRSLVALSASLNSRKMVAVLQLVRDFCDRAS